MNYGPALRILLQDMTVDEALLFDKTSLAGDVPDVARFKHALGRGDRYLNERFEAGTPIRAIIYKRAWLIDRLLTSAWRHYMGSDATALVAVGGYGRGDLLPASDVDLMLLIKPRREKQLKSDIEAFLAFLWDMGLEVGHSVRTVRDCVREAKADITVATNLMEARLIAGNTALFENMGRMTGPKKIWPSRKFFAAKWEEQAARHHKFHDSENNLEPNVKEGPGGLRDIQVIGWVAKRHFGAERLRELVKHGFLSQGEYDSLDKGHNFLWRVRYALHVISGRREDRLLFDHQKNVAAKFGFASEDNSGVEQFMRRYYRTVKEVSRLNEMLLQHFQEEIIYARRRETLRPLNKRFQVRNDFIEVTNRQVFKKYPLALLEIFLLLQQNQNIKGVRASTVRLIRESLHLVDDGFRQDIRSQSLFLEIIRQPHRVGHELRRMHKYGVLGAYMPEFARVEGLMQFDLFHIYTVDEHILFVVRNMRRFGLDEYRNRFPLCRQVLEQVPKQELLYFAGMFHDMAKGRQGDHSTLGSRDALAFCKRHHLSEYDAKLVAWLVEHHLLMSKTAQREDIDDPEVINNFARKVGDDIHLNYLYLLTVADINGTNPRLWNGWKDALIADLYNKTQSALWRGLENPINKTELIAERKTRSLALIKGETEAGAEAIWSFLSDDYFLRYSAAEIAWHTQAIMKNGADRSPMILVREETERGATALFIHMHDHDNIFSRVSRTLDLLGLNVVDARVMNSNHGYTLDTFSVLEKSGTTVKGRERKKEIIAALRQNLLSLDKPIRRAQRLRSRRHRHFSIPTRVHFSIDEKNKRNIMEVSAMDRPGFLSSVGMALEFCGARVQAAKIATYGERAEDIFFITDRNNRVITDPAELKCLTDTITMSLSMN